MCYSLLPEKLSHTRWSVIWGSCQQHFATTQALSHGLTSKPASPTISPGCELGTSGNARRQSLDLAAQSTLALSVPRASYNLNGDRVVWILQCAARAPVDHELPYPIVASAHPNGKPYSKQRFVDQIQIYGANGTTVEISWSGQSCQLNEPRNLQYEDWYPKHPGA